MNVAIDCATELETDRAAARFASIAPVGVRVALIGPLGAGKTQWVRGFVRARAPNLADHVSSPTYALCHAYPTDPPIHHLDLYRIVDADDLESVGFWDIDQGDVLIEWADRVAEVLAATDVAIAIVRTADGRRLEHRALTALGETICQRLAKSVRT